MIDVKSRGSGYYRVYVDDVEISQHITEREAEGKAIEEAINLAFDNPSARVHYAHDYEVDVTINAKDITLKAISGGTLTQPDSEPNPIAGLFVDETDVPASTPRPSNEIQILGVDSFASVTIEVSGDGGYRLNGGLLTTAPGIGTLGDLIALEHQSNATAGLDANTTLTLDGTVSDTFTSTTEAAAGGWQLAPGHFEPQNYALEIVQPRPSLGLENRYYKAYPGFEYNVHIGVQFGSYPYHYELDTAPAGMVIDSVTGVLSWPNPTTVNSPHNITVDVYDQDVNRTTPVQVSWTLTVTTTDFFFIDPLNGTRDAAGGDGSIGNPWLKLADAAGVDYGDKRSSYNPDGFIYLRDTAIHDFEDVYWEADDRFAWYVGEGKSSVFLPYPGETPVVNFSDGAGQWASWQFIDSAGTYLDGIIFDAIGSDRGKMIVMDSSSSPTPGGNTVVRNCAFRNNLAPSADTNTSTLFHSAGSGEAPYHLVTGCTFEDGGGVNYHILWYGAPHSVIYDNTFTGDASFAFSWKTNIDHSTFRGNVITGAYSNTALFSQDFRDHGDNEFCYNEINLTGPTFIRIDPFSSGDADGPHYWYRNTFIGAGVLTFNAQSGTETHEFTKNVMIVPAGGFPTPTAGYTYTDNVESSTTTGVVDGSNLLLDSYLTANTLTRGTRGHEIA